MPIPLKEAEVGMSEPLSAATYDEGGTGYSGRLPSF